MPASARYALCFVFVLQQCSAPPATTVGGSLSSGRGSDSSGTYGVHAAGRRRKVSAWLGRRVLPQACRVIAFPWSSSHQGRTSCELEKSHRVLQFSLCPGTDTLLSTIITRFTWIISLRSDFHHFEFNSLELLRPFLDICCRSVVNLDALQS